MKDRDLGGWEFQRNPHDYTSWLNFWKLKPDILKAHGKDPWLKEKKQYERKQIYHLKPWQGEGRS